MRELLAVLVGGAVGTALRLGIDSAMVGVDESFPWSTLLVNTVGAFALALVVARAWPMAPTWLRAGLGAGLLGSFTTFSAVAVSLEKQTAPGGWMPALTYLTLTLGLGLAAAALGLRVGNPRLPKPDLVNE